MNDWTAIIADFYNQIFGDDIENVREFLDGLHKLSIQALREGNPLDFDLADFDDALSKVECNTASGSDDVQGKFLRFLSLNDKTALLRLLSQRFKGEVKKPEGWYFSYWSLLPKRKELCSSKTFVQLPFLLQFSDCFAV